MKGQLLNLYIFLFCFVLLLHWFLFRSCDNTDVKNMYPVFACAPCVTPCQKKTSSASAFKELLIMKQTHLCDCRRNLNSEEGHTFPLHHGRMLKSFSWCGIMVLSTLANQVQQIKPECWWKPNLVLASHLLSQLIQVFHPTFFCPTLPFCHRRHLWKLFMRCILWCNDSNHLKHLPSRMRSQRCVAPKYKADSNHPGVGQHANLFLRRSASTWCSSASACLNECLSSRNFSLKWVPYAVSPLPAPGSRLCPGVWSCTRITSRPSWLSLWAWPTRGCVTMPARPCSAGSDTIPSTSTCWREGPIWWGPRTLSAGCLTLPTWADTKGRELTPFNV